MRAVITFIDDKTDNKYSVYLAKGRPEYVAKVFNWGNWLNCYSPAFLATCFINKGDGVISPGVEAHADISFEYHCYKTEKGDYKISVMKTYLTMNGERFSQQIWTGTVYDFMNWASGVRTYKIQPNFAGFSVAIGETVAMIYDGILKIVKVNEVLLTDDSGQCIVVVDDLSSGKRDERYTSSKVKGALVMLGKI